MPGSLARVLPVRPEAVAVFGPLSPAAVTCGRRFVSRRSWAGEIRSQRAAVAVAFAGAGEAVEEVDLLGDLEGAEPGPAVLLEAGLGGVPAGLEYDGGADLLAVLGVRRL